jgi:hypothetical protein
MWVLLWDQQLAFLLVIQWVHWLGMQLGSP